MEHLISMSIAISFVILGGFVSLKLLDYFVEHEKRKREKFKKLL